MAPQTDSLNKRGAIKRSLSECDVEEPDGDDRVDLEGPGAGETAVVVVMSESLDILSAQPPHMVGGSLNVGNVLFGRQEAGRKAEGRPSCEKRARAGFPAGTRAHRKAVTWTGALRHVFRQAREPTGNQQYFRWA